MLEVLRYEFAMMNWKNLLQLTGTLALICFMWIGIPHIRANYAQKRARLEKRYDAETAGELLNIRKLYKPAGETGLMTWIGHEISYCFEADQRSMKNHSFIPANPDPVIRRQLRAMEAGKKELTVIFMEVNPGKNTVKLIHQ